MLKGKIFETSLGWVGVVAGERGIKAVTLPVPSREEAEEALKKRVGGDWEVEPNFLGEVEEGIRAYLSGKTVQLDYPLDTEGLTPFQKEVLALLKGVPYGRTVTYRWLAEQVGRARASRAVGQVMAQNPFPLLVPCHRVLRSDGSLGGFGGGLDLKKRLLKLEGVAV